MQDTPKDLDKKTRRRKAAGQRDDRSLLPQAAQNTQRNPCARSAGSCTIMP